MRNGLLAVVMAGYLGCAVARGDSMDIEFWVLGDYGAAYDAEIGLQGTIPSRFKWEPGFISPGQIPNYDTPVVLGQFDSYYVYGGDPEARQDEYWFLGTLTVQLEQGYVPPRYTSFRIIRTGQYGVYRDGFRPPGDLRFGPDFQVLVPELPGHLTWLVERAEGYSGFLKLTTVPEAWTLGLLLSGLPAILLTFRRRNFRCPG